MLLGLSVADKDSPAPLAGTSPGVYHAPVRCTTVLPFLLCLIGLGHPRKAEGYPYLALRPAYGVLSGPTDSDITALHFNPAALRLNGGFQIQAFASALYSLGSYDRDAPLPAGFSGDGSTAGPAPSVPIRWVAPNTMAGASWDLGSDSVTLGVGFYTPFVDRTDYGNGDARGLVTRYHSISSQTYSLWGTAAVALRLAWWFYVGGGFNFAWTRAQIDLLRDPGSPAPGNDGLPCGPTTGAPCEQWTRRQELELNVSGWGYGFTAGVVVVPKDNLWISLSYISALFTSGGAQVGLRDAPDPNQVAQCATTFHGARLTDSRLGPNPAPACGGASLVLSFPHVIYGAVRTLRPLGPKGRGPLSWEISSWARVAIPPRADDELRLEQRQFPYLPETGRLPVRHQTSVALDVDFREIWPGLELGQALVYESPRTASEAVSPANLDGHKLDVGVTAKIRAGSNVWFRAGLGATIVIFDSAAGQGWNAQAATACRASGYDITSAGCDQAHDGWALSPAAGSYTLAVLHGSAGIELHFR